MGVREFSCVLCAVLFSGFVADYLNHYESVTLAAGDAGHINLLLLTADPFNPNSQNTHIEGDGVHAAAVVNRYRGVSAAPSQSSRAGGGDLDCAGGRGNTPVVVGPVKITNGDPNKLDRDHHGVGCE
ncbi:MAG: calcium-binding protein [Mesorhizobium sp.]|uniref:calcium-binding protein n=1 Tax=Mesorhizobium sp. TaxID=1871066 RepID=UPI000FE66996|nr:calcium-binding protein [Mesorhizobium sp.]RWO94077.1 MAG: calcium-binding protein [Mesorhizobium sp.]RWQ37624.1 MAG: calcium-binding protein [Mesorhizobium sp.]TIL22019.1 MAG: calcium-binding protein [Mesorhizobium sp.]